MKIGLALSKTDAFQRFGSRFYDRPFPGCEHLALWTDDYWGCFLRHYSTTLYHQAGTCKMGNQSDLTAVVDPQLRVYNIQNLRVADASIMPNVSFILHIATWLNLLFDYQARKISLDLLIAGGKREHERTDHNDRRKSSWHD